ncbi:MAG TPA: GNAT family N-acetyltransferase [Pseudaminobacter sp.]|nr:GNAT family N-acetyltransferase [Pseudaminobacter sp.]
MEEREILSGTVRRASELDAAAILALVPRLVDFGPPPWRDTAEMTEADLSVIADALTSMSDDPAIFVAEIDGQVVGFVHVRSMEDYYRRHPHGHVADLVVARKAEGLGIGKRLLEQAEMWARGLSFDWLSIAVFEENVRALALYEKVGYRKDITRLIKQL